MQGMPDEMAPALAKLDAKLNQLLQDVRRTKHGINALYEAFDMPAPHTDVDDEAATKSIRVGQFYGQPLATNVRKILEMRRAANMGNAASIGEIYNALMEGGHKFDAKDAENAKAGLRQSLRKNPIFHKIPSGQWGLMEWFPNAKIEKDEKDDEDGAADSTEKQTKGNQSGAGGIGDQESKNAPKEANASKKTVDHENEKTASAT